MRRSRHIGDLPWRLAIFVLAIIVAPNASLSADPQQGRTIVERWCVSCHVAGVNQRASDVGPPFTQIANDPTYTDERLRAWLHDPHPPMPKFELSRQTIDDLIAYIKTLKE